jgi:hypothetical protein
VKTAGFLILIALSLRSQRTSSQNIFVDSSDKFLLYKTKFSFCSREKRILHIADRKEIKEGKLTDVYFVRTMEVLMDLPKSQAIREYVLEQLLHSDH